MKKHKLLSIVLAMTISVIPSASLAHSAITDDSVGHHHNAASQGSYHYYHGYPAHLHQNGVCPYNYGAPSGAQSAPSNPIAPVSPTISLAKPTFGVFVNGYNLNNTTSPYYPTQINGVIYIPLTTEMVTALKLQGGWDATNGMVLSSSKDISATSAFATGSSAVSTTKAITKPTFPVVINGVNLNVTSSSYYPVTLNAVTYVPLTSEVIEALHLSGGWTTANGMVLNSK